MNFGISMLIFFAIMTFLLACGFGHKARKRVADAEEREERQLDMELELDRFPDGLTKGDVIRHYGYKRSVVNHALLYGTYSKKTFWQALQELPGELEFSGAMDGRFRVVIDCDPKFPYALLRVVEKGDPQQ